MSLLNDPSGKITIDGVSIAVAVATYTQVLPNVAALLTVVWLAIRIYETETIQDLISKVRKRYANK